VTEGPIVVIHFKDVRSDEKLRQSAEKRCRQLAEEFREAVRFELSLAPNGAAFVAQGRVTGKNTDVATQAEASALGPATDLLLDKVERRLRRMRDKRIFTQRREAQRDPPKRKAP
jgi:ribosome-associated translation inhibitor RaiA